MVMLTVWYEESKRDELIENAKKYGPIRTALALRLIPILDEIKWTKGKYFIEGGTLLGAWREQKMIPHDDDFDMAFWPEVPEGMALESILNEIKDEIDKHDIQARVVSEYVQKIEIFDPAYGKFDLKPGVDFHHVSIDLTLMSGDLIGLHSHYTSKGKLVPRDTVFPTSMLTYEGYNFPAPNKTEDFLRIFYGYLGYHAFYNPITTYYEKKKNAHDYEQ